MAASRSHRRRGQRPSLRLRGALLVGVVTLVSAMMATGLAGTGSATTSTTSGPVPVVNTAHSWFFGAPNRSTFIDVVRGFFSRGPRGRVPVHRPPAGPPTTTPTSAPTSAPTTDTPPSTTTTTGAPPPTAGVTNTNCTVIVPPAALTAAGLATPYRFVATDPTAGACHEANPDQSAFVEAAIIDPAGGAVSIYHPLVIDDGTQPAAPPVTPTLPRGAVVGIWFGFQADTLTLRHNHTRRGIMNVLADLADGCVNGLPGSPFTQYAYCGAPRFFAAANAAIRAGKLTVPPLGTGADGRACPTTRDFSVVDQDQSDNLPTQYLALPDGRMAQDSAANRSALPGATVLTNGSDNGLVDDRLDPALHCRPFTAPDLSAGGAPTPALALNELQAAADQQAPVALVPPTDPMTEVDGRTSIVKTDLYRAGVDMPLMNPRTDTGLAYCSGLETVAAPRLALDRQFTAAAPSPDPAAASLFDFLTQRLTATWTNLGCEGLTHHGAPVVDAAALTAATAPAPDTTTAAPTGTALPTAAAETAPSTAAPTTTPTTAAPTTDPATSVATTDPATDGAPVVTTAARTS